MSQTSRSSHINPRLSAGPSASVDTHVLRLVLCTQPRSGPQFFVGRVGMRPSFLLA